MRILTLSILQACFTEKTCAGPKLFIKDPNGSGSNNMRVLAKVINILEIIKSSRTYY